MNGDLHEWSGVIRINNLQARREERLHFLQFGANGVCGIQRVRAGRQFNTQTRSWLTVKLRDNVIVFTTQLNARDIAQTNLGAILVNLQQNVAKLFSIGQTSLRHDGGIQLLAFHRGRTA